MHETKVGGPSPAVVLCSRVAAPKPTLTVGYFYPCGDQSPLGGFGWLYAKDWVYEPLIRQTPDGSYEPGLATSWKVAPGNKAITLTLRHDVRFSDGLRMDAN